MEAVINTATTATQIGTQLGTQAVTLAATPLTAVSRLQQVALLSAAFANAHLVKITSATVALIGIWTIHHLRGRSELYSQLPRALTNMKTTATKFAGARINLLGKYTPKAGTQPSTFVVPEDADVVPFRALLTTTKDELVKAEEAQKRQLVEGLAALVQGQDLKKATTAYGALAAPDVGSPDYRAKYAAFKAAAKGVEGLNLDFGDTDGLLAALDGRITSDMKLADYAAGLPRHPTIVRMSDALKTLSDTVVSLERKGLDNLVQYRRDAKAYLQKMQGYLKQTPEEGGIPAIKRRRDAILLALTTAIGNIKDDSQAAEIKDQLLAFQTSLNAGDGTPASELTFKVALPDGSNKPIGLELGKDTEITPLLEKGLNEIYTQVAVGDSRGVLAEACRAIHDLAEDLSANASGNTKFDDDIKAANKEIQKRTSLFNHGPGITCIGVAILLMGANYALPRYFPNWRVSQLLPR